MIKQNLYSALFNSFSNATGRVSKGTSTSTHTAFLPWIYKIIYTSPRKSCKLLKFWMISSLEGQEISVEQQIREGSAVHPYNFLATPQSLFLLPGNYRKGKSTVKK